MGTDHDFRDAVRHWWTPTVRRWAAWSLAAALALPWGLATWLQHGLQPGLVRDPERQVTLIDAMAWGLGFFLLMAWATVLIGSLIFSVMKGRRYDGDAFPPESHTPGPDDDRRPPRR